MTSTPIFTSKVFVLMLCLTSTFAVAKPAVSAADSSVIVTYDRRPLVEQLRDLKSKLDLWNAPTSHQDDNSRMNLLALLGEITVRENIVGIKTSDLRLIVGALVALAKSDTEGETGMLALEITNILGPNRIEPIIKDLDKKGDLNASIKRVTERDL